MFKRLYGFLGYHNILCPLRLGFRQDYSTNHALIQITESIRNSTDNNEFGCGIFIESLWIRGRAYDWFQSYLSNRELYLYVSMVINLILSQTLVEYLRDPFLDPCCFCYILMIYLRPRTCLISTYLLRTLIYIVQEKTLMILN